MPGHASCSRPPTKVGCTIFGAALQRELFSAWMCFFALFFLNAASTLQHFSGAYPNCGYFVCVCASERERERGWESVLREPLTRNVHRACPATFVCPVLCLGLCMCMRVHNFLAFSQIIFLPAQRNSIQLDSTRLDLPACPVRFCCKVNVSWQAYNI